MRGLTGATELKTMRGSEFYKNVFKSSGFQGGREEKREGSENELLELILRVNWRRKWQPSPVFLPGEFHGQRSLVGYNPWGHKESDTIERITHTHKSQMVTGLVGKCKELRLYSDKLLNDFKLGK